MKSIYKTSLFLLFLALANSACVDLVDEGIDIEYEQSDANLTVEPLGLENGAADEMVSYQITVSSSVDIKSCIVQSTNPGQNGSGFNVNSTDFDDPFIDHIFGTIQKGTKSFTVRYDYIIPKEINKNRLTFSIIDESGKVSTERTVSVVPSITKYIDQKIYAQDNDFHDAFATVEGVVYPDIKTNYSSVSEENRTVQEKIDIVFYYDADAKRSIIAAPASERLGLELNIENKTLFRKLTGMENLDLSEVTPAMLIDLTKDADLLKEGSLQISNVVVGDVIGFITDLNATYALKTGILKVSGLHPASASQYSGLSYVLECDIIVQL